MQCTTKLWICGRLQYLTCPDIHDTFRDDTWNMLNMQHLTPHSKRWDYSDIPGGSHKKITGPVYMVDLCVEKWQQIQYDLYFLILMTIFKPASNDFGCICERIWKDPCSMEIYITINRTMWYCSKSLMKLVITTKYFFAFVMLLKWAAVIGYM